MAGIPPRCKKCNTYDNYVPRKSLSCLYPLSLNAPCTVNAATAEAADVMRYFWMGPNIRIMQRPDYGHDLVHVLVRRPSVPKGDRNQDAEEDAG